MRRAIILSEDNVIKKEHITLENESNSLDEKRTLKELEKKALLERLKEFNGNKTHTAKSLDVSVRWIQKKLKEFGDNSE